MSSVRPVGVAVKPMMVTFLWRPERAISSEMTSETRSMAEGSWTSMSESAPLTAAMVSPEVDPCASSMSTAKRDPVPSKTPWSRLRKVAIVHATIRYPPDSARASFPDLLVSPCSSARPSESITLTIPDALAMSSTVAWRFRSTTMRSVTMSTLSKSRSSSPSA